MNTWIRFEELPPAPKTKRWAVISKDQEITIGAVTWFGPWRKYCFHPEMGTVFEQVCLREIADFCESETLKHRKPTTKPT